MDENMQEGIETKRRFKYLMEVVLKASRGLIVIDEPL